MAVLTAKARARLKPSQFALPGGRYPVHDRAHAQAALSRVSQFGSPEEKAKVRAEVARRYPDMEQMHRKKKAMNAHMNKVMRGG